MAGRTREFVLGLLGGIFGFFASILALIVGGLGSAFGAEEMSIVIIGGWSAMIFSIAGIVGSVIVRSKSKLGGWFMIISAIGGLISISGFYILSFVLLLIGGLMGIDVFKKGIELGKTLNFVNALAGGFLAGIGLIFSFIFMIKNVFNFDEEIYFLLALIILIAWPIFTYWLYTQKSKRHMWGKIFIVLSLESIISLFALLSYPFRSLSPKDAVKAILNITQEPSIRMMFIVIIFLNILFPILSVILLRNKQHRG